MNGSDNVSEKTRKKVLAIMEEENYTPNIFARGLGLNSMHTVGIICSNSADIFLASAIYFLEQELRKYGYDSLLCCTGYEDSEKIKYMDILLSKRVDAIVVVGSDFIKENNDFIIKTAEKLPVFLLNSHLESDNIYSVLADDCQIMQEVTIKLINDGYQKLLFLNRRKTYGGTQKLNGFINAHKLLDIKLENWQNKTIDGDIHAIVDMLTKLRDNNCMFDGVLTSDDELAIAVIKFAKQNDIKIPNQLAVVGYNNSRLSEYCEPELSSIDNKLEYCCQNIISKLINVIENKKVQHKTIVTAEFIKRNTTTKL